MRIGEKIIRALQEGGAGVLPTDTIYGIVGSALFKKTVERVYKLRKRNPKKPMIILIASSDQLRFFGIRIDGKTRAILKRIWPGKVSAILPIADRKARREFEYLHRGTGALAFRLPEPSWLRRLLAETGPLVAPSANPEGKTPARTVKEAKKYFGVQVDFYRDAGRLNSAPSTLVKVRKRKLIVLREGAVKI